MKVVVITTLFLGLTAGIQTIEVTVDDAVETVELAVDGEVVQQVSGPPWKAAVDLGRELAPIRLTAVARDGDGAELGRDEQWINLIARQADAELWLERDDAGRTVRAGLVWESSEHGAYSSLRLTFDGEPLAVPDPASFELPPHDADALHVLSAELALPDGEQVRADLAFGGAFGEELSSELTGVPVAVDRNRGLRRAEDAGPWLRVDGEPRPVLAVDHGAADLFVVMDRGAHGPLVELGALLARQMGERATVKEVEGEHGARKELSLRLPVEPSPLRQVGLHPGDRLFLVRPVANRRNPGYSLFGLSAPLTDDSGGTAWQLAFRRFPEGDGEQPQLLAEAVATVALRAAASGRPRAVVLILGPGFEDASAFTPDQTRRYLERMGVPLEVWYVDLGDEGDDGEAAARERRLAAARGAWGPAVRDVPGVRAWVDVNRELRRRVGGQRILWIEGIHPPGRVEVVDAPGWVEPVAAMLD